MVRYNHDRSVKEYTNADERHLFKGVRVRDPSEVASLDLAESALMWTTDMCLADGNVVFVETVDQKHNPFVYRSTHGDPVGHAETHAPSEEHESKLVSSNTDMTIEFTNYHGWDNSPIAIYPFADEHILEQLGELHKLLIHKV